MGNSAIENDCVPILEYPFTDEHKTLLLNTFYKTVNFVTIRLDLPLDKAYERFHKRDMSGDRHPGHYYDSYPPNHESTPKYQDYDSYKKAMDRLNVADFTLGKTLVVDAMDLPLPVDEILTFIKSELLNIENQSSKLLLKNMTFKDKHSL